MSIEHEQPGGDLDFLREAYKVAMQSPDPSTQNGAILVRHGRIIAAGYNRPPFGVEFDPKRHDRAWRYRHFQHAERGVVIQCAAEGPATLGAIMYCPFFACTTCAQAIIDGGIAAVVGHADLMDRPRKASWSDEIAAANAMLQEANVVRVYIVGKVGGVRIRFDEEEIEP